MRGLLASLRVRLVALVLIATVPAFVLILWAGLDQRREERVNAQENVRSLAQIMAEQQGQVVEGGRGFLGLLVGLVGVSGRPIDPEPCNQALASLLKQNPRYADIGIADAHGMIVCSGAPQSQPADASESSWFQRAVEEREFVVGTYQVGGITKKETIDFGYPVLNQQGDVQMVVFAALDLAWLNGVVAETKLASGLTVSIFDRNGVTLVRHPEPEKWVGQSVPEAPLLKAILANPQGTAELSGADGVERLYAFTPVGDAAAPDAYLSVGTSTAALFADANRTLTRNLLLLGVVGALALAAAWFGGDWFILRGVRVLVSAAERVEEGDLQARTGLGHDRGEIGQLAGSFDQMAEALERRETDRNRAEEALRQTVNELARSNSELEQFAYVASHDLQEPLRMVGNYTQLLARRYKGTMDSDADDFINYAVEGAQRMQELINDLLAFSRVGTRGNEPAATPAETVLEQTLLNLGPAIEEAKAQVTHDPLPTVQADAVQLGQVFQNLIGNALKFHDGSEPRIHVSAELKDGEWVFSVRDNGIGIGPEYHERIFVIFQRLHGREQYRGTGMGLAICKKIVERHGGRIWVESDGGKGSAFYFSMPASAGLLAEAA